MSSMQRWTLDGIEQHTGAHTVLRGVQLTLDPGLHVLLGPTGAGKTSLLRILAGLDRPSAGRVCIGEREVTRAGVRARSVAMVYQQFINYPSLDVFGNIAAPLRQRGELSEAEIDQRVRTAARTLRIEAFLGRFPAQLSGGQQQRTAIARALVREADLLLLDEPLVNLDYKLREELRGELRSAFASRGSTIVYATTEPQEALILGGKTAVLDAGRILEHGPSLDVYLRPRSARAAEVTSDPPLNWLPLELDGNTARIGTLLQFAVPSHCLGLAAGRYRAGLRPHQLRAAPALETRDESTSAEGAHTGGANAVSRSVAPTRHIIRWRSRTKAVRP